MAIGGQIGGGGYGPTQQANTAGTTTSLDPGLLKVAADIAADSNQHPTARRAAEEYLNKAMTDVAAPQVSRYPVDPSSIGAAMRRAKQAQSYETYNKPHTHAEMFEELVKQHKTAIAVIEQIAATINLGAFNAEPEAKELYTRIVMAGIEEMSR